MTQNGAINCKAQGPVPERLISANPGLKFCHDILFCLPMHCLEISVIISFIRSKGTTVFCKLEVHVLRQEYLA